MRNPLLSRCVTVAAALVLTATANAQDLVITNGRILDGTGKVIDRGSVVVRGGKIVSVSAAAPTASGARTIDAGGKTVMPGLIDAHRHLVQGDGAEWLATRAISVRRSESLSSSRAAWNGLAANYASMLSSSMP